MIRRKSDANKKKRQRCTYAEQIEHERCNQQLHQARQQADPEHDPYSSCWCCCTDCEDLTFHPVGG